MEWQIICPRGHMSKILEYRSNVEINEEFIVFKCAVCDDIKQVPNSKGDSDNE